MAEELKNWFNEDFFITFINRLYEAYPKFDTDTFLTDALAGLDELELMDRLRRTTHLMHEVLPDDYNKSLDILYPLVIPYNMSFASMLFPDYVGRYGRDHYERSIEALEHFTRYSSSEFAIREFLKLDFERTIKQMTKWAKSDNEHVRRLASEGSRPRLPWSFKLPMLIADPTPARKILDTLKADDALYVRKSVANHLNDISKDNADLMLDWVNQWDRSNPHSAWISKHASRSLLKQGHPGAFALFDFEAKPEVSISHLRASKTEIRLGDKIDFEFNLLSRKSTPQKLAIDYKIHYVKKSGQLAPKVFKLKELTLDPGEQMSISKSQIFKNFTTRKHYEGTHKFEVMINGGSLGRLDFSLLV